MAIQKKKKAAARLAFKLTDEERKERLPIFFISLAIRSKYQQI